MAFITALLAGPSVAIAQPAARGWRVFRELMARHQPRGPEVTDLYLAAAAIGSGLEWVSFDRGFGRFAGLRWTNPADDVP